MCVMVWLWQGDGYVIVGIGWGGVGFPRFRRAWHRYSMIRETIPENSKGNLHVWHLNCSSFQASEPKGHVQQDLSLHRRPRRCGVRGDCRMFRASGGGYRLT